MFALIYGKKENERVRESGSDPCDARINRNSFISTVKGVESAPLPRAPILLDPTV